MSLIIRIGKLNFMRPFLLFLSFYSLGKSQKYMQMRYNGEKMRRWKLSLLYLKCEQFSNTL